MGATVLSATNNSTLFEGLVTEGLLPLLRDWLKSAIDDKNAALVKDILAVLLRVPVLLKQIADSKIGPLVSRLRNKVGATGLVSPFVDGPDAPQIVSAADCVFELWTAAQRNARATAASTTTAPSGANVATSAGAPHSISDEGDRALKRLRAADGTGVSSSSAADSSVAAAKKDDKGSSKKDKDDKDKGACQRRCWRPAIRHG